MNNTDFKKHPFEHLKLIKVMDAIEAQWQSKQKSYKNYHRANKKALAWEKARNKSIESLYHIALPKIKQLFSKLSRYDRIMVEMNLKLHPLETEDLHSIFFSTAFFDLCCDMSNNYFILYKFHNCPVEAEVRALMNKLSLTYYSREDTKIDDYTSYFKRVLQVQPERFISLL